MLRGGMETFTATVSLSNGTVQPLTGGTWGTDAALVASVGASNGVVNALGAGEVTIFVDAQGVRGSKRIQVVPNYQGIWVGSYLVTACTATGDFITAGLCDDTLQPGQVLSAAINFMTQAGPAVSGQTLLGSLLSQLFSATVAPNGGTTFTAVANPTVSTRVNQDWTVTSAQASALTGSLVQTWIDSTLSGQMVVTTTMQGWAPSGSELTTTSGADQSAMTLSDVAAAITRRIGR
jgi:hypothetical protein